MKETMEVIGGIIVFLVYSYYVIQQKKQGLIKKPLTIDERNMMIGLWVVFFPIGMLYTMYKFFSRPYITQDFYKQCLEENKIENIERQKKEIYQQVKAETQKEIQQIYQQVRAETQRHEEEKAIEMEKNKILIEQIKMERDLKNEIETLKKQERQAKIHKIAVDRLKSEGYEIAE